MNTSKSPFHIAVVGGGIGGLCITIGLLHHGVSCALYEAASAFAEIGAGLSFGPNALEAMALLDPEIQIECERIETRNGWPDKRKTWFDFRVGDKYCRGADVQAEVDELIAEVKARGIGKSSVHRAQFLDVLINIVPEGVALFGKRLHTLASKGEKVKLGFNDGTIVEADAVIGCDGIKSRTRQILLGESHEAANAKFSGVYAYRGLVPMNKAVAAIGDEFARNGQMYLGNAGHVLTFPIERGATMNVVAFQTKQDGKWEDERWVLPAEKEDMINDFHGWGETVQRILSLMEKPDMWALFEHAPAPTYAKGRMCLLGDSAHASTPHQEAGAGQAVEDAFILSNLLGQIDSAADIEKAFTTYGTVRRPRSQRVVNPSREAGDIYEFKTPKFGFEFEKTRQELEVRMKWIWEEDLPGQLRKAQELLNIELGSLKESNVLPASPYHYVAKFEQLLYETLRLVTHHIKIRLEIFKVSKRSIRAAC